MSNIEQEFLGAIPEDNRTQEEKDKDYPHFEILGMGSIEWREKPKEEWVKLTPRNQNSPKGVSFSCGGQALAKGFEYSTKKMMSARPPYLKRVNAPAGGMAIYDLGNIAVKTGTTIEELCPSVNMTEAEMNVVWIGDTPFKFSAHYNLPIKDKFDIDLVATALQSGHVVIFGVSSNREEWGEVPVFSDTSTTFSHYIVAIPGNDTLHKGQKAVVIDDSDTPQTTIDGKGQRILTENFLKNRCWGIKAFVPFKVVEKPKFFFARNMQKGSFGEDVKQLQQALAHLDLYPTTEKFDGIFGKITKTAVIKFQTAHGLLPDGIVGAKTRFVLNQLFS